MVLFNQVYTWSSLLFAHIIVKNLNIWCEEDENLRKTERYIEWHKEYWLNGRVTKIKRITWETKQKMPNSMGTSYCMYFYTITHSHPFKGALSGLRQFFATESPLKIMKNAFYFTLKSLFVLKIFNFFLLTFLVTQKNGLIRKTKLVSTFLTNISRIKGTRQWHWVN